MKIKMTAREICDADRWLEFCNLRGMGEYAMAEGQMSEDEYFEFSEADLKAMRMPVMLLMRKQDPWGQD